MQMNLGTDAEAGVLEFTADVDLEFLFPHELLLYNKVATRSLKRPSLGTD